MTRRERIKDFWIKFWWKLDSQIKYGKKKVPIINEYHSAIHEVKFATIPVRIPNLGLSLEEYFCGELVLVGVLNK